MSKSSTITRASSIILPSALGDVTYSPDRTPFLQFVLSGRNGSSSAGVQLVKPVVPVPGMPQQIAPPPDRFDLASKGIIILPSRVEPVEGTGGNTGDATGVGALARDLETWVSGYVDIGPLWTKILVRYALMTWLFDRFTALPYLRFLGEPQSGKTRCLQVASALSYKCISMAGASSASSLFRLVDLWRGTVALDEADYRGDMYSDIIKLLNQGYMHGLYVTKSEKEGTSYEARGFNVYGPKILTTRRDFEDFALESRCLTLRMLDKQPSPRIPRQLPITFADEALSFRNRLLSFRHAFYDRLDTDESELLALVARTTQIALPIWAISKLIPGDENFRHDFLEMLSTGGEESRTLTPPAVVAEALRRESDHIVDWRRPLTLEIKSLTERAAEVSLDWGLDESMKFNSRSVGTVLRSWGIGPYRAAGGTYEFALSGEIREEICRRYKPPEPPKTN